jgi:cysteinyl-tRNA synthetase
MAIHIYNSLTRKKEEFIPLEDKHIKMYVCGPTVYDEPHIGHARSAYIFDVIRRYLVYRDYKVTFVRNVTDVDDKIIKKAKDEFKDEDLNLAVRKVSQKYLDSYHTAMSSLGILPPDFEPKATEYITEMQGFIQGLIERGAAYESGGDVYFDIKKAKDYGKLSNQSLDKMEAGARIAQGEKKKDPLDFALWKSAKEGEPSWESPWGRGRPGWHIECSVMSSKLLGDEFDIHGGGLDLIFPHHENEVAQSEGAGKKFARCWIHHGLLTINGQKMAKSLGNFITIRDLLQKYNPDIIKFFFLSAHYASPIDFSLNRMDQFKSTYEGFANLFNRLDRQFGTREIMSGGADTINLDVYKFKCKFEEAMDDNFNTPQAISVLFELVSFCNKILDRYKEDYRLILSFAVSTIYKLSEILGVTFKYIHRETSDSTIELLIKTRLTLKKDGNFKEADLIRKSLEDKGIILEDAKDGKTTWRRKL